jgi:CDP-diacylglycerol--glycerol-3-phosphate 3-phosphatidyltransferase
MGLRLAEGLAVVVLAIIPGTGLAMALILALAFVSDVADGMVARRAGFATPRIRALDSAVELIFIICTFVAVWLVHRDLLSQWWPFIAALLGVAAAATLVDLVKFGRLAAYHAYSAKAAGVALFVAGIVLFGFGRAGWVLGFAMAVTIFAELEHIAITLTLRHWTTDVPSYFLRVAPCGAPKGPQLKG